LKTGGVAFIFSDYSLTPGACFGVDPWCETLYNGFFEYEDKLIERKQLQ
jgi:hypothetical protein